MTPLGPDLQRTFLGDRPHWSLEATRPSKEIVPSKMLGGEQTIRAEGGVLFPDVLLFGDRATARILQGWELKMPDTSILDAEFRQNAEAKARALGLDSFLLWNVSERTPVCALSKETENYALENTWSDLIRYYGPSIAWFPIDNDGNNWQADIVSYLNDLI